MRNPQAIRETDDAARDLARDLLRAATHAALGVLDPDTGTPVVTRIALATGPGGAPVSLVSDLSAHTAALRAAPACSLLLGEPGAKGDPLTHPRMTLLARAGFVARDSADHAALRAHYLEQRPKAGLYADFGDFHFVRFAVEGALVNGGFGRAYRLTPADLAL